MSWIAKAESLLNKIDQSAAVVLQQKDELVAVSPPQVAEQKPSTKMILTKSTPKKAAKNELDERWESMSETASRRSSFSSKHSFVETVIDKTEDQKSQLKESLSNASLNSFSVEKELAATKILVSELKSENNELKSELEQLKTNGDSLKIEELEVLCATLMEEKRERTVM